jgi:NAD(P)-dependent dehydrogenase (short-subunit alcohol dehydrogenase family)
MQALNRSTMHETELTDTLSGRLALVTGASRGIGRATALALAKKGAHVIAVARTVGALEELDDEITQAGGAATLVPLDLKDHAGIARLGGALFDRYKKLDILVGNAGILGPLSPLSHVEPKAWDEVMAVNVTANWHLIRSMEPLLTKSDAGRAVFISSGISWTLRAYWGPYAISKAALNAMVQTWAKETISTNVRVNLVTPGPIRTRMRAQALPGEDPESLETPDKVAEKIIDLCRPEFTETGKVYAYPVKRMVTFQEPH